MSSGEEALVAAWLDDDSAEVYTDLSPADQAIRDAAQVVIDADPIRAFGVLLPHLDGWDGVYALTSWFDAAEIWNRP